MLVSALILETALRKFFPEGLPSFGGAGWRFLSMICLGLTYYPLLKGHSLGQIQVFLSMFAVLSFFLHLVGRRALAGACMGLCCLVKPQYGILLLWAILRRNWRFLAGSSVVLVAAALWSAAIYGLGDYASYWKVLKELARHGEPFWANQSLNGLLNRLLLNGSPTESHPPTLALFHPAVYAASTIFAAVVHLASLGGRIVNRDGPAMFWNVCAFSAAAIASPSAWEHHLARNCDLRDRSAGRPSGPDRRECVLLSLLFCMLWLTIVILRPELMFPGPVVAWPGQTFLSGRRSFFFS